LASDRALSTQDYSRLLAARSALAGFARHGEERARLQGLTHVQHHLLLAVHAHPDGKPGVVDVAAHLALRPNSSAELVDRAVAGGYLERPRHASNRRRVHLRLTPLGAERLALLSPDQLQELAALADLLATLTSAPGRDDRSQR